MSLAKSGLTITNTTFTGATKFDIMSNIRSNLITAGFTSIVGAAPTTVTITIASPAVVTMTSGSAPAADTRVVITTTSALPTGLTANTTVYFVKSPSGSTFNLAATAGGAAINTSGSQSGTHSATFECVLQSVATPQSNQLKFRFRDNGGSCITASIENNAGTATGSNDTSNGCHLLPAAAKTFRIICTGYWFYVFVPGSYSTAREFLTGHVIWLPSSFGGTTTEAGFVVGQSASDSSSSIPTTWRNGTSNTISNAMPNQQAIWNANLMNNANNFNNNNNSATGVGTYGPPFNPFDALTIVRVKYSDGSFVGIDPWVTWSPTFADSDCRVRGMLWDAVFVMDNSVAGDTSATFDSNTWMAIGNLQRPTLWTITA